MSGRRGFGGVRGRVWSRSVVEELRSDTPELLAFTCVVTGLGGLREDGNVVLHSLRHQGLHQAEEEGEDVSERPVTEEERR